MLRNYIEKRRKTIEVESYREESLAITSQVLRIFRKGNVDSHVVQFFIETCEKSRLSLLGKYHEKKLILSSGLREKIEVEKVESLRDCMEYSNLLMKVYKEQPKGKNPFSSLIFIGKKPVMLGEHLAITGVLLFLLFAI